MTYSAHQPTRDEVDALPGATVLEFGTNWCGICAAAQPAIGAALQSQPGLRHLKIEDGPGRPLGHARPGRSARGRRAASAGRSWPGQLDDVVDPRFAGDDFGGGVVLVKQRGNAHRAGWFAAVARTGLFILAGDATLAEGLEHLAHLDGVFLAHAQDQAATAALAMVGSIIARTSEMRFAGKPERSACSRIICSLGAM